ncbi:hypothetical protein Rhal01_00962 [Rubritalea halochordaticola]|uniref:Cytochrome c domain-containing protein n=1 Tax=Rubritalea halochordaticola TaxID=714537 RepID=A0ABP9UWF8_9BACT
MNSQLTITLALIVSTCISDAKKTQSGRTEAYTPEQELAGFSVPEGFVVELVASEKDGIVNPIDLTFDASGRLWTQTARMYPLDPVKDIKWNDLLRLMDNPAEQDKNPEFKRIKDLYQGKTKGQDDILILSNIYENKQPTVTKWASGLTIPQSILPYKNGAFVAQGSELFYLEDTDQNGSADKRTPVLTGFGFTDTHTMAHTLVRAPGGWINFSQGALNKGNITATKSGNSARIDYSKIARFSLDGNKVELVNAGLNNIWGFQLRGNGQWYMTEANDHGLSVTPAEPYTAYKGIGNEKLREYQPFFPALHKFRVGGTGISGLAFADDTTNTFPEEYKNVAFLANPITSTINCVRIVRDADGTVTAEHLPDLLKSEDDWFRPVNIEFGPDGCLYIADWYNKIVSHNEVATTHPDRDKSHGRIWRIRHQSQTPREIPNLQAASNDQLLTFLHSPSLHIKRNAAFEIIDRQATDCIPQLIKLATDSSQLSTTRIHALWALEGLHAFDQDTWAQLLKDEDANLRRETVRSLANLKVTAQVAYQLLSPLAKDPHVMVRSQVIRTLEKLGSANADTINLLVSFCHAPAPDNTLGGHYEQNFERYLARRALERYPEQLKEYFDSALAKAQPSEKILWAQQALDHQSTASFLKQWTSIQKQPLDKETLTIIADLCKNKQIANAVTPYFASKDHAQHIAQLALDHIQDTYTTQVGFPLAATCLTHIKSNDVEDQIMGTQLATAYRITHIHQDVSRLLDNSKDPKLQREVIKFLSHLPAAHTNTLLQIANDTSKSSDLRIEALTAYTQAKDINSLPEVTAFLKNNENNKHALISAMGSTVQGCKLLASLIDNNQISITDIPSAITQRIVDTLPKGEIKEQLSKHLDKEAAAIKNAVTKRIPELTRLYAEQRGNTTTGKAVFTGMCLSCHVVGEDGVGIAPALDGSANRDLEHLLTAILLPDEAAEGAYVLYRVTDSAGHIFEGYKLKQSERGTMLAIQGGLTTFIPHRTIAKQEHVGSKSFMPSGTFDKLPDQTILDLLSYIKTLK